MRSTECPSTLFIIIIIYYYAKWQHNIYIEPYTNTKLIMKHKLKRYKWLTNYNNSIDIANECKITALTADDSYGDDVQATESGKSVIQCQ